MLASRVGYLISLLCLTNLTLAVKYRFSIQEVRVQSTRDVEEDDVLLVVASFSGTNNNTNNWPLGSVVDGASIKWDNLTQEIDVPSQATNLSVAIGVSNTPDQDEQKNTEFADAFVKGIVGLASAVPGPQAAPAKLLSLVLGYVGDLFDCSGPTVLGNVVYTQDTLENMNQNQKDCADKTDTFESPNVVTCGPSNSSYTVTYCLERLDPKSSAASGMTPSSLASLTGFAMVAAWGSAILLL